MIILKSSKILIDKAKQMGKAEKIEAKYNAPALDKGLDILELLASAPEGMTQAEIAKGLGRRPNEIYRMLDTLVRRHYVSNSATGDRYILSLKLLVLGNKHPPRRRLLDIAEPLMRLACKQSEQSCQLVMWEDGNLVAISAFSAPGNWRFTIRPGAIIGLFDTGSGRVLTAFQNSEIQAQMISEHVLVPGEKAPVEAQFKKELQHIKQTGYCKMASQVVAGATNLSFPILDSSNSAIACLTSPYLERIDVRQAPGMEEATEIFAEAANQITQKIGGNPMSKMALENQ